MNSRKMNKLLKIILVSIVVLVGVGLFFADKALTEVTQQTVELKAQVEAGNKRLKTYEITKIKLEQLRYIQQFASDVLPQTENQSAIVAELSEFAKRSNLLTGSITFTEDIKSTTPVDPKKKQTKSLIPQEVGIVPVVFKVSGEASYEDVLTFIKYIESNRRKMQITQISLTPSSEGSNKLQDISISLNLFVKKTEKEAKR